MNSNRQDQTEEESNFTDWSRELWFALMFVCIGWTVWPLMIYFLGRALDIEYFISLTLRVWAEDKVYGPITDGGLRSLSRLLLLFFPWLFFFFLRFTLNLARKKNLAS